MLIQTNAAQILKLAKGKNFWGKKLRSSQLAVCDEILKALEIAQTQLTSADLAD